MRTLLWAAFFISAGCSEYEFGGGPKHPHDPDDPGVDDTDGEGDSEDPYTLDCDDAVTEVITHHVVFEETTPGDCWWDADDALPMQEAFVTAQRTQRVEVPFPDGRICDLDLEIDADLQAMHVDDTVLLVFNDTLIAASWGKQTNAFPVEDEIFHVYSWESLVGFDLENFTEPPGYCLGQAQGLSDCTLPGHDVDGFLDIQMAPPLRHLLADRLMNDGYLEFSFVSTGDNKWSVMKGAVTVASWTKPQL